MKTMYVVMTDSQDRYATISCIGVFDDQAAAELFADQVMLDAIRDEGRGLEIDEVNHDTGQYTLVLSHDELDFKVIVDHCPDRTGV